MELSDNASIPIFDFLNSSASPFHVIEKCKSILLSSGFHDLNRQNKWDIKQNERYFYVQNNCVFAVAVGNKWKNGNGAAIVASHIDSPSFKLKQAPDGKEERKMVLSTLERYGSGKWSSWMNRDLGLAGKVIVRNADKRNLTEALFDLKKQKLIIPSSSVSSSPSELGMTCLWECPGKDSKLDVNCMLSTLLNSELGWDIKAKDIFGHDIYMTDTQPASFCGLHDEFIHSQHLDNLINTFSALYALIEVGNLEEEENLRILFLFDGGESDSKSALLAACQVLENSLRRLSCSQSGVCDPGMSCTFEESILKSMLVVAGHVEDESVDITAGVIIKQSEMQHHGDSPLAASILKECILLSEGHHAIPETVQIEAKEDFSCNCIGEVLSARLALLTVEVGIPMIDSHTIREIAHQNSVSRSLELFKAFFTNFSYVYNGIEWRS